MPLRFQNVLIGNCDGAAATVLALLSFYVKKYKIIKEEENDDTKTDDGVYGCLFDNCFSAGYGARREGKR